MGLTETCLRVAPTTIRCWGYRRAGMPLAIKTYRDVVSFQYKYWRRLDGSWGYNDTGVAPHVDLSTAVRDMDVGGGVTLKRIPQLMGATTMGGEHHVCALLGSRVWCWGLNDMRQLGYDTDESCYYMKRTLACSGEPRQPRGLGDVAELAVGFTHTCARRREGGVVCWGSLVEPNAASDCGATDGICRVKPAVPIRGLEDAVQIATSETTLCGVRSNGTVACLGPDYPVRAGQPGSGDPLTAIPIDGFEDALRIALSRDLLCAIDRDSSVRCKRACRPNDDCATAKVEELTDVRELAVQRENACVLRGDHSLWCWGNRRAIGIDADGVALAPVQLVVEADALREVAHAPTTAGSASPLP